MLSSLSSPPVSPPACGVQVPPSPQLAQDPVLQEVAAKHDVLPTQVALAWLLASYDKILLIPGTTSVGHLEENLAAADVELDADDMTRLEDVTQLGNPMASH